MIAVVVALLAAGGAVSWASASSPPGYRTALVTTGDVQQLFTGSGTISLVHQSTAGFASAGTVRSVAVSQGQQVTAGQVLATLDTGPLDLAVLRASAALAKSRAALETDQTGGAGQTARTSQARPAPVTTIAPRAPAGAADTSSRRPASPLPGPTRRCGTPLRRCGPR